MCTPTSTYYHKLLCIIDVLCTTAAAYNNIHIFKDYHFLHFIKSYSTFFFTKTYYFFACLAYTAVHFLFTLMCLWLTAQHTHKILLCFWWRKQVREKTRESKSVIFLHTFIFRLREVLYNRSNRHTTRMNVYIFVMSLQFLLCHTESYTKQ